MEKKIEHHNDICGYLGDSRDTYLPRMFRDSLTSDGLGYLKGTLG